MVKRLLAIVIFLLLLLGLILALFLVRSRTQLPGRAQTGILSLENSYVFASPLIASANGQEKIRVTIFALDTQGIGVANKPVFIGQNPNLVADPIQSVTDSLGKAIFDISAQVPAEYLIEVQIEGKNLPQTVKVTFR